MGRKFLPLGEKMKNTYERQKEYRKNHRKLYQDASKRYYKKNKDKILFRAKERREYKKEHKDRPKIKRVPMYKSFI